MRVLLLIPPEETYIEASAHHNIDRQREPRPKLGVLYVGAFLKAHRPETELRILDCPSEGIDTFGCESFVRNFRPHLVGITALSFTYFDALKASRMIKGIDPSIKVCMGGIHTTLYPEETLMQESVDYVVIGEGELTFSELLSCVEKNETLHTVKGLGFRRDSSIIVNEPRDLTDSNLDNLPFPNYDLVNYKRYSHVLGVGDITLSIQTSRGCPFKCAFCSHRRTRYRYRSAESVTKEMEHLVKRGIRSFFFVDDNFTLQRDRVINICKAITKKKWDIDFKVSSRIDTLDEEMMEYLKQAGCSRISLGVESSHQKHLDYLDKDVSAEQAISTIEGAHRVGLPIFAYMMIGFPGQTWEEMLEEVRFLKRLKVEYASFSLLSLYPKTELYSRELKKKALPDDIWQEFARQPKPDFKAPLANNRYTQNELRRFQSRLAARFYFTFDNILCRVKEAKNFGQIKRYSKIAYNILFRG